MKLFKLLTTTAITTMAVAAMSVSASAALTATYTYDSANSVGTIELSGIEKYENTQLTLLVLSDNVNSITEENKEVIKQIDQGTNSEIADVKVADLSALSSAEQTTLVEEYNALADADKTKEAYDKLVADYKESATYYVRVGGTQDENKNYVILTGEFTVPTTVALPTAPSTEPEGTLVEQGYGDLDESGEPDPYDAALVLGWYDYELDLDENQLLMGDIDQSGEPDPYDAALILGWYDYELDDNFGLY